MHLFWLMALDSVYRYCMQMTVVELGEGWMRICFDADIDPKDLKSRNVRSVSIPIM